MRGFKIPRPDEYTLETAVYARMNNYPISVEVVNARTLEDLQRKLNHQRLMVQLAHKTFHELTQRSHKPEDDYNPSELLKVVAAERDERIAALEKQLAAANDRIREAYAILCQLENVYRRQSTESVGSFGVSQEVHSLLKRAMDTLNGKEKQ